MKILELSLQAFGPFTDVTLDFSRGREGLHLVYGPNEAGKSSALRGLRQALFGFPPQSPDDFLHSYQKLRVGLRLRDGDGRELAFVRRKGAKNTLLAADGSSPLPDAALANWLNGMTEAEFSRRFALDHDELVAGGKSILEGAGELGQLLFQAGGGLKDLLEVQRNLDRELESLFKPTGTKPRINRGLDELKEARATVREGSLPSTEWVEHDAAHRRAAEQLETVESRLESARAAKRRLERIADALPVLARRRQCQEEREALGPVVLLPDNFNEQRHQAVSQLESARTAESAALRAIKELDAQINALVVPEDLLAESEAIERLRDGLAGYRKAQDALPAERSRFRLIESDVREILAELCSDGGATDAMGTSPRAGWASPTESGRSLLDAADAFRPTRVQKAAIARLTTEVARLTAEQDQAGARVAELAARLESEQAELDRIETPSDTEPLAIALRQARDQGDLDAQIASARIRLDQADAEAARALAQLPMWSGPLVAVVNRPVPPAETIDRFEAELADLEAELARLRSARDDADSEASNAEAKLSELRQAAGVLPTEDDLARFRFRRDQIWRLIRRAVETGHPPSAEEVRAALDEAESASADPTPATPAGLAMAYERAVQHADACADRLRREAERVAAQASTRAALDRARHRQAALDEQTRQAAARAEETRTRWHALWEPLGISPLSPREMRGWLQARQAVVQRAADAQARRAELEELQSRSALHRAAIARALGAVEARSDEREQEPAPAFSLQPSAFSLQETRDRAEAVVARLARAASRRDELIQSAGQLKRQLESARAQVQAVADRLRGWREAWARAVAPLGLPTEATPEQADAVLEQASSLAARIKEARETQARIESFERETGQFAGEVKALCHHVAAESGPAATADRSEADPAMITATAMELIQRLATARQAADRRDALRIRREQELAGARSACHDRETAERRLDALCREAGCASPDDLPAAERASLAARQLQVRIQELDQQLGRLCGNEPLEAFRQSAMAVDVDRIPDRIAGLAAEIDRLDAERARLNQELGHRRSELARMDGEGRAAEANERVEHLKSRLTHEVEEYARLRLAAVVLREAIERYRHKTQGPVLDRAGRLFAALTLGSFQGLRVEYDDRDQPVLQALRAGGTEAVGIRGLSLGTADQLYLALRLASLETALESHGPVPLIADDVLIQFDDRRTAAALELLSDLSERTQVILFTHHKHVCELAQSKLQESRLFIQRLPGQAFRAGAG
jgi:uncharacterized protein YhaN